MRLRASCKLQAPQSTKQSSRHGTGLISSNALHLSVPRSSPSVRNILARNTFYLAWLFESINILETQSAQYMLDWGVVMALPVAKSSTPRHHRSTTTAQDGALRGWLVVFGAFLNLSAGFGVINSFGTYQNYYTSQSIMTSTASGTIASLQVSTRLAHSTQRQQVALGSTLLVDDTLA